MKKRSFLMAAFAAMFMASCSDNDLNQVDDSFIVDGNYKAYFKVAISNPPSTNSRALNNTGGEEFKDGEDQESKINSILFVFYNQNRHYVAHKEVPIKDGTVIPDADKASIEATVDVVVPVGDQSASAYVPYYVMAYVNPTENGITENAKNSMDQIKTLTRGSYYQDPEATSPVFLMNNATYYASKSASAPSNAALVNGHLYTNEEEAKKGTAINIYVERLAAKVSVTYKKENVEAGKVGLANNYTLTFTPEAWKLNGTAKQTYLVKQFVDKAAGGAVSNLSYDGANKALAEEYQETASDTKSKWNDISNFRSYWCTSYFYQDGKYPKNTFEVKNDNEQETPQLSLNYYSYNDAVKKGNKFTVDNKEYCLEHTVNSATNSSSQQLAALTSVIVVGKYKLTKADGTQVTDGTTFYRRDKTDEKWNIYVGDQEMIAKMQEEQYLIYVKNGDEYKKPSSADLTEIFQMKHPGSEILGGWVARVVILIFSWLILVKLLMKLNISI